MLIPDDKGSLLPLAGERGDGEDLAGVPVDEVEALHLAQVPEIVGHRLVHAQRGYSQTTCYTENQVFCFELFTVAHLFGFHSNISSNSSSHGSSSSRNVRGRGGLDAGRRDSSGYHYSPGTHPNQRGGWLPNFTRGGNRGGSGRGRGRSRNYF